MRGGRAAGALGACALWLGCVPGIAAAVTVSGPHETIETSLTTTRPDSPAGISYKARYFAADDPSGDPPYMRRMTTEFGAGLRYDTSVPDRCMATDAELGLRGAAACPPESRVGGGTADGKFMGSVTTLQIDVFNNTGEQVMVIASPGWATVSRGTIHPDGTIEFASPTCYPAISPTGCPVDNALQLGSDITIDVVTRAGRGYLTTPPTCPSTRVWATPIRFWWSDGTEDTVVANHPCSRLKRSAARAR